jgi:branched-chain amino acid transport system ATP-binding protein
MTEPLLRVRNVSVTFGGLQALVDFECDVEEGEILGIIGPNGAGKTTLLNALSRLVRVGRGASIRFAGHELMKRSAHQVPGLGLGRTFQAPELSSRDTLLDNVLVGGYLRHPAPWGRMAAIRVEAEALLRSFGIDRWARLRTADVPYPVQKRAQICRAMLLRPRMLLLDEPAAGITAEEKRQMADALVGLHQRTGVALFLIEHDVGFLTSICRRMIALDFGRKIASGSVADVINDPAVRRAYLGEDEVA